MMIFPVMLAAALVRPVTSADEPASCPELSRAGAIAHRMSELPADIRDDLVAVTHNQIRDVDVPLLNTDAPGPAEAGHAAMRFVRAARFGQFWLIQY